MYVRITQPNNSVVCQKGTIPYENSTIGYSAVKIVEYTGEEMPVTVYVNVSEYLTPGTFHVYIFTEGTMIGSGSLTMQK